MGATQNINIIKPQEGYQMKVLASKADIVVGGAAAGVGKTFALLLEPLRHLKTVKRFGGVIYRRTTPQIRSEGGLWDTSVSLYPFAGGRPRESNLTWVFDHGNTLKFSHLEHEKNKLDWQGSQIPYIGFDELTHFSESMFFYLLTRNRSTCGVKPYVRATCNPDPDSWVAKFIEWWIDQETGYPIKERDGVLRYFIKNGQDYIWGDSKEEVLEKASTILGEFKGKDVRPEDWVKSLTFISGSIFDNKKLLEVDSGYLGNLLSQDEQTQNQLLRGNWKHVIDDKDIYPYEEFVGMFNNVYSTKSKEKCITADIALKGSNKFVVMYWEGKCLCDISILDVSDGKKVIDVISGFAKKYKVPNNKIIFDADGVGGFVDGFLIGAIPFHGGASPLEIKDTMTGKRIKENYHNLKTQLYYRSGDGVKKGEYTISEEVSNRMYDKKMTVRQRFLHERRAIKRDKTDSDGKLRLIPKEEMKIILSGESPDIMDSFSLVEYFDIKKGKVPHVW